jgi:trk system potassium uptake protein TrkH
VIVFMILAGANFTLHYHLFRHGRIRTYWKSEEFRIYIAVILGAAALISFYVASSAPPSQGGGDLALSIRLSMFQVASIVTTTGYATADYELWPMFAQVVIFVLMFAGGCAGSTGGGVKIVRHLLLTRSLFAELKRLLHPRAIIPVRMDGKPVPRSVLGNIHSFALLYMMLVGLGAALLSMRGVDLLTSFSAALSCLSNVGPAFGAAGPAENYSGFDATSKWVLSLLMLTGRLELYTVAVLLTPSFWKH